MLILYFVKSVVVCILLGDSPASEFYMPTFQNTVCSIFIGAVSSSRTAGHPKERIQHSEHGRSLKSRICFTAFLVQGKGKKAKRSKMFRVDNRILGFSVTAAQDRINVGDRDYVEGL